MRISIDECKERTARIRASKDAFIKACSSNSYENQDEDLKVIDVYPIKSLFCNMNLDETEYDLPLLWEPGINFLTLLCIFVNPRIIVDNTVK